MNKTELQNIIREVLREELAKIIIEDTDRNPMVNRDSAKARSWSADALASNIYRKPEFKKAFEDDGWVLGDKVEALVTKEVSAYFINKKSSDLNKNVDQVLTALDHYTAKENKDSDFYDWRKDDAIKKIHDDTHDEYGNEY
jgi:hypothetical protein